MPPGCQLRTSRQCSQTCRFLSRCVDLYRGTRRRHTGLTTDRPQPHPTPWPGQSQPQHGAAPIPFLGRQGAGWVAVRPTFWGWQGLIGLARVDEPPSNWANGNSGIHERQTLSCSGFCERTAQPGLFLRTRSPFLGGQLKDSGSWTGYGLRQRRSFRVRR